MIILVSFIKSGKCLSLFLKIISLPLSIFLLELPQYVCLGVQWCPTGPFGSVYFNFFSFCSLELIVSIALFFKFIFFWLLKSVFKQLYQIFHFNYVLFYVFIDIPILFIHHFLDSLRILLYTPLRLLFKVFFFSKSVIWSFSGTFSVDVFSVEWAILSISLYGLWFFCGCWKWTFESSYDNSGNQILPLPQDLLFFFSFLFLLLYGVSAENQLKV